MTTTNVEVHRKLPGNSDDGWCKGRVVAFFVAIVFATSSLQAAPITVPTDLNLGDQYRLAFVTSTARDATSSNIADYNTFVTTAANSVTELAAVGTTWKAIGSTATVDARDNTGTNPSSTGVPIYRLDDTRIADNNADLWDGTILASLSITEDGNSIAVWVGTGTHFIGTADWVLGAGSYTSGESFAVDSRWVRAVHHATPPVPPLFSFYGMSGVLVVPEPSTLALLALGGLFLLPRQRNRHARTASGHHQLCDPSQSIQSLVVVADATSQHRIMSNH